MNKKFRFVLGERVCILGKSGICRISGRGQMEFISGGKMPWYCLEGAYTGFHPESALITIAEAKTLPDL